MPRRYPPVGGEPHFRCVFVPLFILAWFPVLPTLTSDFPALNPTPLNTPSHSLW